MTADRRDQAAAVSGPDGVRRLERSSDHDHLQPASLALAGGFFLLALVTGMSLHAIGLHLAAAAVVLVDRLYLLFARLDRRRRCQARGRDRAMVRLRLSAGLSDLCLAVRRRADADAAPVPELPLPAPACAPGLDHRACMRKAAACLTASRSRPRRCCLSGDRLDAALRRVGSTVPPLRAATQY